MNTQEEATGRVMSVTRWRLCFDRAGHGQQTITWPDRTCQGDMRAVFGNDGKLTLSDTERCHAGHNFLRREFFVCERISDNEASRRSHECRRPGKRRSTTRPFYAMIRPAPRRSPRS